MTHSVQGSWWQTKMGFLWLNRSNAARMSARNGSARNRIGNGRQLTECWVLRSLHHGHLGKWVCTPQPSPEWVPWSLLLSWPASNSKSGVHASGCGARVTCLHPCSEGIRESEPQLLHWKSADPWGRKSPSWASPSKGQDSQEWHDTLFLTPTDSQ